MNITRTEKLKAEEIPFSIRNAAERGACIVRFGALKVENPNFAQELQMVGRIGRVICPEQTIDRANVLRDDGTEWTVMLSNFEEVVQIEVGGRL